MRADISVESPRNEAEWAAFREKINGGVPNDLLDSLILRLREAGAATVVREHSYIDRDFSAAYSAFYATLFRPFRKYCERLHFFDADLWPVASDQDVAAIQNLIEARRRNYLGSLVLRPLTYAPLSAALLSAPGLAGRPTQEVTVRSRFRTHALGVELQVSAMPLTQQDTRTGACAQASMWMAGRHFHNRHGAPWFSMPGITEIALNPIDSAITRSLPAGSEWLTQDNMVRALRAMGRHPVMYAPDDIVDGAPAWRRLSPKAIIARYVDSGVPVLLGLQQAGTRIGHGVVAVGFERAADKDVATLPAEGATTAEFLSHFLVNDDQRGAYCRLPINAADGDGSYPFCLETDIKFLLVPLPGKVFMMAETAEIISRNMMSQIANRRHRLAEMALDAGSGWDAEPSFYEALQGGALVSRTYLTYGWKYKSRMLRNDVSEQLKMELLLTQLPRFVWVTEYALPAEAAPLDPCARRIRAHVVVDATGSQFGEGPLILDAPGLSIFWQYDPDRPIPTAVPVIQARQGASPYRPKIRGRMDYASGGAPS